MKQPNSSLQLPKPARNTPKIAYELMTVASGEVNTIYHVAKVKVATPAHSMADVTPFLAYLIFHSNPTLR